MFPKMSLVLGGVSSGKSDFAENLVLSASSKPIYFATAQALDDEMNSKIAKHRDRRGSGWRTAETPTDLAYALGDLTENDVALIDCATMWLTNHMMAGSDISDQSARMITAMLDCPAKLVVVSNEVGLGGVSDNSLARQFERHQGELNRQISGISDLVVTVIAGLPLALKGAIPALDRQ